MTKEIASACEAFNLSREDLRNVIIYGFKRSFYPGSYIEKRAYVRQVIGPLRRGDPGGDGRRSAVELSSGTRSPMREPTRTPPAACRSAVA